jgi:hypothetical protein
METASDTSTQAVDEKRHSLLSSSRDSFVSLEFSPAPDKDPESPSLDYDQPAPALPDLPSLKLTGSTTSGDAATISVSSFADEMEEAGVDMFSEPQDSDDHSEARGHPKIVAKIYLREEKAAAVHDTLHFIYPQYASARGSTLPGIPG